MSALLWHFLNHKNSPSLTPPTHLTLLSFSIITASFDLQQLYHKVALVTEGNLLFSGMMLTEQAHITEIR